MQIHILRQFKNFKIVIKVILTITVYCHQISCTTTY